MFAHDPFESKKPLQVLEKIKESLDRLNEKMEIIIELQKHGQKEPPNPS